MEQVQFKPYKAWVRSGQVSDRCRRLAASWRRVRASGARPDDAPHAFAHARVTLVHALVGAGWIMASDRVLALASADLGQLQVMQTYKGLFYVAATTLMLYLLLERVVRSLSRGRRSLLDKQHELETLLANLPGGVYRRGANSSVLSLLSRGAATLFGVRPGDAAPNFYTLIHADDRSHVERRIQEALSTRGPFEISYRVAVPGGGLRWLWDQGRCLEAPDGSLQIEGFVCDVTEHRRLQERLQHTQRLESIGCMASSIAHDFNNVLFAIESGCELLTYESLTDTQRELVTTMRDASHSGSGLVARLLAFARDQGCQTCELELNAVVQRAQPLMKRLLPGKIELKLQLESGRGTVQADATQLEQVLLNLVTNAGHAIHGHGQIGVSTSLTELALADASRVQLAPGRYLVLSVEDNGCGIDPAVLPRIFEPFFTTKGEGGTGLGLATVQKIVRDMGGAISVWSERSQGTRFTIYLPTAEPARRSLTVPPPAPHAQGGASGAAPRKRTSSDSIPASA